MFSFDVIVIIILHHFLVSANVFSIVTILLALANIEIAGVGVRYAAVTACSLHVAAATIGVRLAFILRQTTGASFTGTIVACIAACLVCTFAVLLIAIAIFIFIYCHVANSAVSVIHFAV